MKKILFILIAVLISKVYVAQTTYTLDATTSGTTITTCSGTFVDAGGSGGNYGNGSDYTITFCPGTPGEVIRVAFSSFATESTTGGCLDYLDVFQGDASYAAPLITAGTSDDRFCGTLTGTSLPVIYSTNSANGCITFRFVSDGATKKAGWVAAISCVTPCQFPTASLLNSSIVSICGPNSTTPGSRTVNFDASSSTLGAYTSGTYSLTNYNWTFGDGTVLTTTVPTTSYTYPNVSGIYLASLIVGDNNTAVSSSGCKSTNSVTKVIQVLPAPTFSGTTTSPQSLGCGSNATLTGIGTSQTETQSIPSVSGVTVSLPDGNGTSFVSGADFSGLFPTASTISSGCYPVLWFNLEHSYSGDLFIDLVSPSGQTLRVYNRNGGDINFGKCSNGADNGVPGCGQTYSVSNTGTLDWDLTASTTTTSSACPGYTGACESGSNYKNGVYTSDSPFSNLNGASMNGVWQIKITDNQSLDDGFLFSWGLVFPAGCYASLESVTPDVVTGTWTDDGSGPTVPVSQTTTTLSVSSPGPDACPSGTTCVGTQLTNTINFGPFNIAGNYPYTYSVNDEYGCSYTTTVNVSVSCACPTVALVSYVGGSFCKSLTSAISPTISGSGSISGGTYSSTPSGLSLDAASGVFTPSLSTVNTYTVTYLVVPSLTTCPAASINTVITIYADPTVAVSSNTTICAGTEVILTASNASSYSWSNGETAATNSVSPTSTTIYSVTGTSNGCQNTQTVSVTVISTPSATVTATSSNSAITCQNSSVTLTASVTPSGSYNYTWSSSVGTTSVVNVSSANVYSVIVSSALGCSVSAQYTVTSNILTPSITVNNVVIPCGSPSITISANSTASIPSYSWTTSGTGSILAGSTVSTPTIGSVGQYVVTVTDNANGCSNTATVNVTTTTVTAAFTANPISGTAPLLVNFTNQSTGASSYSWTFGDITNNTSTLSDPSHTYNNIGNYNVILVATDASGLCSSTATISIDVLENSSLIIPNVFTPNGDGSNDVFKIKSTGIKDLTVDIFNRWGKKLYTIASVNDSWDGGNSPDGTYFFVLKAVGFDGKEYTEKGFISLFK